MPEITAKLSTALADRYQIERRLGEGGMATVYLAEDLKHKQSLDRSPAWRLHRIF
jgi:serine/threonine-protein kinase